MKAKMLKIAGVKSEKEFYKKYPTEEAFMKAHGKAFKKAQWGVAQMTAKGLQDLGNKFNNPVTNDPIQNIRPTTMGPVVNAAPNPGVPFQPMSQAGMANWNYNQPPQAINPSSPAATMKAQREEFEGYSNILDGYNKSKAPKDEAKDKEGGDKKKKNNFGLAGDIVQGIQALQEEKRARRRAEQAAGVSDVARKASESRDVDANSRRRYNRPEDLQITGEEMFPIYGVGTNVLTAKSGAEITNTFAPNTLYTDLREGGEIPKAKGGFAQAFGFDKNPSMTDIANAGGGDFMSDVITKFGGENAGGNLGGSIGKAAGQAIGGPVGGMIGQVGGQLIGSLINQNPNRIKKAQNATMTNAGAMAFNNAGRSAQAQYSSFMEDGGRVSPYEWVSHTWQPQEIVKFGEHNVSDLLKPDPTMDTLRAGGHLKQYTAPTEEAMFTGRPSMEDGGELQTHWGGYAEPMSYNPYLPEGGETVMFRGQSHDESDGKGRTGIGITYGDSPVEVERGEPAMKMKDGGEQSSLVVFGNLKILHNMLGDPKAKGKNFKSYVADITKQEQKLNKSIDKNTNLLDSLEVDTPFDKLRFNSYTANLYGGNQKLKEAAAKKMDAAALQTAMNDTIEEYGMKTSDRGTISAKNGIEIAQDGKKTPKMLEAIDLYTQKRRKDNFYGSAKEEDVATLIKKNPWYDWSKFNPNSEKSVKNFQIAYNKKAKEIGSPSRLEVDGLFGDQTASAKSLYGWDTLKGELIPTPRNMPTPKTPDILTKGPQIMTPPPAEKPNEEDNVNRLKMIFNEALPFLRPTDAEPLDPRQLYGEMYALSTNQLEPVQAQTFQPELSVPYDISLQDILNENEATFRSQQRMAGYNPAAQAMLNAQKYQANQKVLGEQFRMNQAMKDQVYRENRNIINESRLKNLDIFDRQYTRQEEAKSKTKAINQEALNSIAAKYQQNQLENRTLQVYENQYNYRFDPRFRAINMNPLADLTPVMDEEGNVLQYVKKTETQKKDKFGRPAGSSTTVTSKAARNGSIVRSLKSI